MGPVKTLASVSLRVAVLTLIIGMGAVSGMGQANAADDGAYELRLKFQPGEHISYLVLNRGTYDVRFGDVGNKVLQVAHTLRVQSVIAVDKQGNARIELSNEKAYLASRTIDGDGKAGQDAIYDSTSAEPPAADFAAVPNSIGKPVAQLEVSPLGKVLKSTSLLGQGEAQDLHEHLGILIVLPEEPVRIGDSWKEKYEDTVVTDPQAGLKKTVSMQRRYTLKSVENGRATIECVTASLTPLQDPNEEAQLLQKRRSGVITFHIGDGRIERRVQRAVGEAAGIGGEAGRPGNGVMKAWSVIDEKLLPSSSATSASIQTALEDLSTVR